MPETTPIPGSIEKEGIVGGTETPTADAGNKKTALEEELAKVDRRIKEIEATFLSLTRSPGDSKLEGNAPPIGKLVEAKRQLEEAGVQGGVLENIQKSIDTLQSIWVEIQTLRVRKTEIEAELAQIGTQEEITTSPDALVYSKKPGPELAYVEAVQEDIQPEHSAFTPTENISDGIDDEVEREEPNAGEQIELAVQSFANEIDTMAQKYRAGGSIDDTSLSKFFQSALIFPPLKDALRKKWPEVRTKFLEETQKRISAFLTGERVTEENNITALGRIATPPERKRQADIDIQIAKEHLAGLPAREKEFKGRMEIFLKRIDRLLS